jgi:acyl carrier protein
MDINELIEKIEEEFEEAEPGSITAATSFRELDEWSSMHALIIIALIDTEYDVTLTGEDLSSAVTVQDLYDVIVKKQS